ncbi:helix-turn-helix domain-containing protein [Arenibaculum pallidiluteum]|uniref:helix-turn-helix domain-containing protein n=1 Tax=Arenibaculum pallidiluteum TaxID=2812559 RepID=UPI001A964DBC|nr:helix-turn-helix domain-containing protein [Arenibaculum pallidiluteum]
MDTIGNRIRTLRLAKGWSLQQLATRVGASKPQIDKLEKGTRRLTADWQERIATALGVDRAALLAPARPTEVPARPAPAAPAVLDTDPRRQDTRSDTLDTAYPESSPTVSVVSGNTSGAVSSMAGDSDTLPLRGFGRIGPRGQPVGVLLSPSEAPEHVWMPAPLAGVAGAYAVRMPDTSMVPRYQPGQLLFVHPYRTPRVGDPVVVLLGDGRFVVGLLATAGGENVVIERLAPPGRVAVQASLVRGVERIVLVEEP